MAVDASGSWIVIKGDASISFIERDTHVSGTLFLESSLGESAEVYAKLSGTVEDDGSICLTVSSTDQGVPSFSVSGKIFEADTDKTPALTFVLTDGTTVLGLTCHVKVSEK